MSATCFVCVTCGTQFAPREAPPTNCPICDDERQYVGPNGQQWTTLDAIERSHRNELTEVEPNLHMIQPVPKLGIGQRAFLVRTAQGNLLWDCVPLIDDITIDWVRSLGGLAGIAISHPHYYSAMVEWSQAFGNVPIHLHRDTADWVMRPTERIQWWEGESHSLFGGLQLVRLGGHFKGFQALNWPNGADGRGVMLVGDQPYVCPDPRWVSFMHSYPNMIPLPAKTVLGIKEKLSRCTFDRIYGAFTGQLVSTGAKEVVNRSADRYVRAIAD